METLKIGVLAARTGTSAPTIRYYESIGLLPSATRGRGGQRTYDDADVERLTFIRRCRDFGFPVEQVRALVALGKDTRRSCTEVRTVAQAHLDQIRAKVEELRALELTMRAFVQQCDTECAAAVGADCVPLGALRRAPATGAARRA